MLVVGIGDFQDCKYPEAVAKEMRRSLFRMGNFSVFKTSKFFTAQQISSFFPCPGCEINPRNDSSSG